MKLHKTFFFMVFCLSLSTSVWAYGPFYIYGKNGERPYHWPKDQLTWKYDKGNLTSDIPSNSKAKCDNPCSSSMIGCGIVQCIEKQLNLWQTASLASTTTDGKLSSIQTSDLKIPSGVSAKEDITVENYKEWFEKANTEHFGIIIFDEDGSILEDYVGKNQGKYLLGLTVPNPSSSGSTFTGGMAIFNGLPLSEKKVTPKGYSGTILHELGHLLGLDHSQPMKEVLGSESKSAPSTDVGVPTMYPSLITEEQADLHVDDVVGISFLYPNKDFTEKFCVIKGDIKNEETGKPYQGVNVIAYADNDDKAIDARSFVSGVMYPPKTEHGEYLLYGIVPGVPYRVIFEAVLDDFRTFQGGLNPYPEIIGPTEADIANANNEILFKDKNDKEYQTVICNPNGAIDLSISANPGNDKTYVETEKTDGKAVEIVMQPSDAPKPDPNQEVALADEGSKKKGWCMSVAGGNVSPAWGLLLPALILGLYFARNASIRRSAGL